MVKVNLGGCSSFVKDAEYKEYVEKAFAALEVLENETGKGNDFLGWKHLPSETLASGLVAECEAVRDAWKAKNIDLVVVIGIGGSYLGAKCALEALSHQFAKQPRQRVRLLRSFSQDRTFQKNICASSWTSFRRGMQLVW